MGEAGQGGEAEEALRLSLGRGGLNLYAHFPFCRRKCAYCALHSRAGSTPAARAEYVRRMAEAIASLDLAEHGLATVYFGGGSPALCDLRPLLDALRPALERSAGCEFTVELHPLDATDETLGTLRAGGANRISMGVQSFEDDILAHMGRGYSFADARRAFDKAKSRFDNAGIDLIAGYPGESKSLSPRYADLGEWGLAHCSVYSLILEEKSILAHRLKTGQMPRDALPDDDRALDRIRELARILTSAGLRRYEISNYAVPGLECRHNMAVWRGEDYIGLGEGAYGRMGVVRTVNWWGLGRCGAPGADAPQVETLSPAQDETERRLFRLRTIEGIDTAGRPDWVHTLDRFAHDGLVIEDGSAYRLTERGTEVCDAILAELV